MRWLVLMAFAGCWRTEPPPVARPAPVEPVAPSRPRPEPPRPDDPLEEIAGALERFTVDACACPTGDTACAQNVVTQMQKWSDEIQKRHGAETATDPDFTARIEPVIQRFTNCLTNAMTPATP